jgi:hypothetical protein
MNDVPKDAKFQVDGSWGIYVPQRFINNVNPAMWHIKPEDIEVLKAGPDHEHYWETWDDVLNYAWGALGDKIYNLYQDGDLWAYCAADQDETK